MTDIVEMLRTPTGCLPPSKWELAAAKEIERLREALKPNRKEDGLMKTEVTFTYKNYRGEISVRLVRPIMVSFGATAFHPDPQWLLHGWDINKDAERTFAMKDIKDWEAAPISNGDRP